MRAITVCLLAVGLPGMAAGQDAPPQASHVFQQLFPHPTGQNGFEELVMAGDMAKNCAVWQEFENHLGEPSQTLTQKRDLLSDPTVQRILSLVRAGLAKPLVSIHPVMDANTLLPEMALYRDVARLMMVEQYVLLADGKAPQCISAVRDGLAFGYGVQCDTLISGLVGIAIDAIVLKTLGDHLDQLSARDCDQVIALANDWLKSDDPAIKVMERERETTIGIVRGLANSPASLDTLMDGSDSDTQRTGDDLKSLLRRDPTAARQTLDQAAGLVTAQFGRIIATLQRPVWERPTTVAADSANDGSLAARLYGMLAPVFSQATNKYGYEQATVQLLAVHAAIRRYRWEHNELPANLDVLKLGRLGVDPFSGKPFQYRLAGSTYEIFSVGYPDSGAADASSAGQRTPIYFPRRPANP